MAFARIEESSRKALKTLYESGLEKPLASAEDGPAQLLPFLVEALEEVVSGIGPMAEVEAHALSSVALTCVFNHVHLRDPGANLDELLEPVDSEHCTDATEAVKGQVEALLTKFRAFATTPTTGATDPAASGGGADGGNTTTEVDSWRMTTLSKGDLLAASFQF